MEVFRKEDDDDFSNDLLCNRIIYVGRQSSVF